MPPSVPTFELDQLLGTGTSGSVWRGVLRAALGDRPEGCAVAVKVLHPELADDPLAISAFESEAEVGRRARHPSLVRLIHAGEDERGRHIVMDYLPGLTLAEELAGSGPFPEPRVRAIGAELAGGLAALHAAGFGHGDVKPDNVRSDADGRAVLLDLGFARPLASGLGKAEPKPTTRPGSLAYLAPEQTRGAPATAASDVFALGVLLYELATGVHPFTGDPVEEGSADQLPDAIAAARFRPPSEVVPQLSPFLDHSLAGLLSPGPAERPTAEEVERRLSDAEAGDWWRARVAFHASARRDTVAWSGQHLTPHAGRDEELHSLRSLFERATSNAEGGGAVLWLEGEPGSGKSRLVQEFAAKARAADDPPLYLYGRCSEWLEERPGNPVRALLRRWLRLPRHTPLGPRERELLDKNVPPHAAKALTRSLDPDSDEPSEVSVPDALSTWLLHLARESRLIVFLDDVGWAGAGTLQILTRVASEISGTRLFLILGLRPRTPAREPEALEGLRRRVAGTAETIRLGPLDEEAVLEIVEGVFHHTVPRLRLARALWDRSRGNPGLVGELLRELQAGGKTHVAPGGKLFLEVAPDDLPLPRSLSRVIADEYRALPPEDRRWLRRLAVAGGRIETAFLMRAFAPASRVEIDEMLARLVEHGWLVPVGARYRFARPAQREAVYRAISPERRVRLHAAAASAFVPGDGERRSVGTVFQRAFHLRSAGSNAELLRELPALLRVLVERGHTRRVHTVCTWGLEAIAALPHSPERERLRIELLETAADATNRLGRRSAEREVLDRLSDLPLDPEFEPRAAGRIYLLHGRYAASTGQFGLARGMLRNAAILFENCDDKELASEALRRLAHVQGHVGELTQARELSKKALECASNDIQRALAHLAIGFVELRRNRYESALRYGDRAMKLLRKEPRVQVSGAIATAHLLRARTYRIVGRPRRALASIQHAARLAHQAGDRRLEAEIGARMGGMLLDVARENEAEMRLREALLLASEIEDQRGEALASFFLGTLLAEAGDAEARGLLGRAAKLSRDTGMPRLEALSLALRARVAREAGDLVGALDLSERSMALTARAGAELPDRIVIVGTHALLLSEAGDQRKARELERELERSVRRKNARIEASILRQRQRRAATQLLRATLSPEGHLYPRVPAGDLPGRTG